MRLKDKAVGPAGAAPHRRVNWGFWAWLFCAVLALVLAVLLTTAWAVRHALSGGQRLTENQARLVLTVAEFPALARNAVFELRSALGSDPSALLLDRSATERPYWVRQFPAPEDDGYLLFSGVDRQAKQSVVQLIRVADAALIAQWKPDWPAIDQQTSAKKFVPKGSSSAMVPAHPLLLDQGDIVFNTNAALVRLGVCSAKAVWVLDHVMHHSTELDTSGAIWVPSVADDGLADNPWLRERMRDDALALVSPDGRLLEKHSVARILRDNGLQALLLGTTGFRVNEDPIHLNEIQVARNTTRHWQRGDLLVSMRHLSTVFLYRPSTRKMLWHQTGPWMNQHSVDFVDDHRISIFDNNIVASAPSDHAFMDANGSNRVIVHDFDTGQDSQPFAALLAQARPRSVTGGRARILPDGGLFVEETNFGRHLRFTSDRLLWSRVNDYDAHHIGAVSWSRYLTAEEAQAPLAALAAKKCVPAADGKR